MCIRDRHEVLVQHENRVLAPVLTGSVTLEWQRKSAPGTLDFTCAVTEGLALSEGDAVSLRVNGKTVFFGYIFEKSRSGPYEIAVKAYDQLRYLKNKGTLAYAGKTYTCLLYTSGTRGKRLPKRGGAHRRSKKLIEGGDTEANYAYYCLHKLRLLPHDFLALDPYERAFVIAAIDVRVESEQKEQRKLKRK